MSRCCLRAGGSNPGRKPPPGILLSRAVVELVGILNLTPDSFSDGRQNNSVEDAVGHAEKMLGEGASIIDVGAESTRPGAKAIDWSEEVERLSGFVRQAGARGWNISLDTYHPETIDWVSQILPAFIINDVTGFRNPAMRNIAAQTKNQVIVSHLPKASHNIQAAHRDRPVGSIDRVVEELYDSIGQLIRGGVAPDKIIADPGIGFGKTAELNWKLLEFGRHMPQFPVMVGYSRKRFLGVGRMRVTANRSAGRVAVEAGAKYLRVHDVRGHAPLIAAP